MKLVTNCSHVPSRRPLLRHDSSASTDSCLNVHHQFKVPSNSRRLVHSVRFNDDNNEVYFNPEDLTSEEIDAAWYSDEDMDYFRFEMSQLVEQLIHTGRCRSFQRAYLGFCGANSVKAAQSVMEHSKIAVSDITRGMESYMLLQKEKHARKVHLMEQVQYWSATRKYAKQAACQKMVKSCCYISLPDRLFAYYVAKVAAKEAGLE